MKPSDFLWLNVLPICCIAAAAALAVYDKPGWGWFLFIGACFAVMPTGGGGKPRNSED